MKYNIKFNNLNITIIFKVNIDNFLEEYWTVLINLLQINYKKNKNF